MLKSAIHLLVCTQYSRKRFYSRHFHTFSDYRCVPPFFNTASGHAYSLNTDIREPSSMVYESFIQHGA